MRNRWWRLTAILLLSASCAVVAAQTCRTDITPTAPDSRFTDHGDGTVSDAATGLRWKRCAEGLSGAGCASGAAATFTWQNALQQAADTDFAGRTDWRLPNKNELESLVERRCYNPAINATFFPNTPSDWFWSASPYANDPYYAWSVYFYVGSVYDDYKYYAGFVRLVRGGQ
ncbi:DUF1566 domain-containing protein [uncultured Lamprocystis sp.]|jgi:hypothetical protein|uniref:Lcl C-terminal domain-containing protein n=1 Tax=uncultured Lamprocystis sp. TaxID=543132 RepID=UPI0025CEE16C|nr:DUF1566 domain-containing protein [uncultured Lamprocystis sp.]